MFDHTDKKDSVWLLFLTISGVVASLIVSDSFFSASVLLSGILCVGFIAIGRVEGYYAAIYNSVTYAWLAHSNGLFGETMLNLGFFLPTSVLGIFMWKKVMDDDVVQMRALSVKHRVFTVIACIVLTILLGNGLEMIEGQNSPYMDATTNVLSVVATFLMLYRYMEQWFLYFVLNVVTITMWVLRYLDGGNSGDLMIIMWVLFLLNSVYGCWRWHTGARNDLELQPLVECEL